MLVSVIKFVKPRSLRVVLKLRHPELSSSTRYTLDTHFFFFRRVFYLFFLLTVTYTKSLALPYNWTPCGNQKLHADSEKIIFANHALQV